MMRVLAREQGRFVSRAGLRKVAGPSDGQYALIIVDSDGCPVSALTEWYRLRQQSGSPGTRRTYLGFLLPFFGYLLAHGLAWNSDPEQMHHHIRAFLRDEVVCQISRDTTLDGYLVELTGNSPVSQSSLRVLLAAIRDFYAVMAEAGLYPFPNPMCSPLLQRWKRERIKHIENGGAPDHAGIRGETWTETQQQPTAFFRQRRGKPWQPDSALTSEQIQRQLHADLDWMIQHIPTQRDRLVLLLLRYTGARLHEILSLTAGGYRKAKDPCQAYVLNKGSLGREEKLIRFPQAIEAALVRYIRTERAQSDSLRRRNLCELEEVDPIFLTNKGTSYSRTAFYFHWRRWYAETDTRPTGTARLNFSDGNHLLHMQALYEWLPADLRDAPLIDWTRFPSSTIAYLTNSVGNSPFAGHIALALICAAGALKGSSLKTTAALLNGLLRRMQQKYDIHSPNELTHQKWQAVVAESGLPPELFSGLKIYKHLTTKHLPDYLDQLTQQQRTQSSPFSPTPLLARPGRCDSYRGSRKTKAQGEN